MERRTPWFGTWGGMGALGAMLLVMGCPRTVPIDHEEFKGTVEGTIAMSGTPADYDVNFDESSLVVLVLPHPEASGPVCDMLSHPHAITAHQFDAEFEIDPASPTDSWIKITVPGQALNPDEYDVMQRFDETKESEEKPEGDREGIKGTAFDQLNIDEHPDLVFEVKGPPAVEGDEQETTIAATMKGKEGDIEVTYTAAFENDDYVINLTGNIDGANWEIMTEGFGAECTDKNIPLNVTLVLTPKS
jgi:hypothetical protein